MKVMLFHIGNPTPVFETEFELMKLHERAGDAVLMLQCRGGLATCLWNTTHKALRCAECRSKFKSAWKLMQFGPSVEVRELRPPEQPNFDFPREFKTVEELSRYEYDGVRIGAGVASTLASHLRDHQFETLQHHSRIILELTAAIQTYDALKAECIRFKPDLIYIFNGRVSTQLPALLLCYKLGVKFATYETSRSRFNEYALLEGGEFHDRSIYSAELERLWSARQPGDEQEMHKWFHTQRYGSSGQQLNSQIDNLPEGFDATKRNIVIFNTTMDEYQFIHTEVEKEEDDDNAKIAHILESFKDEPEFMFYLRVHPNLKEYPKTNTQLRAIDLLRIKYKNLAVIAPDALINSYRLMEACEKTITFGSTIGVEATYWGRPSIMLGPSAYEGLGCVYRPSTHEETVRLIRASHLPALSSASALKYGSYSRVFSRPYEFFKMDGTHTPLYQGKKMQLSLLYRLYSRIRYAAQQPKAELPGLALRYFYRRAVYAARFLFDKSWQTLVPKQLRLAKRIGPYKSYSQAHQDVFVLEMLEKKRAGYYVEIGAYDEVHLSNTYTLEKNYGWNGFSIEWDEQAASDFNAFRRNECICCDATTFDYAKKFEESSAPKQIDYLQLDIEPASQTFEVLKKLPLDKYRFSVITYEHDMYVSGSEYMIESRKLLESFGYQLVVSNVRWHGHDFEDWYVDPKVVPEHVWRPYVHDGADCSEIFSKLK